MRGGGINEETVTARAAKEINFQRSNGDEEGGMHPLKRKKKKFQRKKLLEYLKINSSPKVAMETVLHT